MDQTARNVRQQIDLYGEPLGDVVRRIVAALGLTQGGLAQVVGLSAPMLSQLVSAQRVKIGNPAVVTRLRAVSELADLAVAGGIEPADVAGELDSIRASTGAYTGRTTAQLPRAAAEELIDPPDRFKHPLTFPGTPPGTGAFGAVTPGAGSGAVAGAGGWIGAAPPSARAVVRELQDLFRAVASADEIQRAAAAAAEVSPAVAELLLAYGTGRTADALAHYEQHHA
jgi:hypothetical protein